MLNSQFSSIKKLYDKLPSDIDSTVKKIFAAILFEENSDINSSNIRALFETDYFNLKGTKIQNKQRKKSKGSFYTPDFIAEYITRKSIISYLSNNNINTVSELFHEYQNNLKLLENKLESIKILDIACGPGIFLSQSIDILLEIYIKMEEIKNSSECNHKTQRYKSKHIKKIVLEHITGIDVDPNAIFICRLALLMKIEPYCKDEIDFSDNIIISNIIINQHPKMHNFNIIIGNPPYIDVKQLEKETVSLIFANYQTSSNRINLFATFLENALDLLEENGILGNIIPNSLLYNSSFKNLRFKFLTEGIFRNFIRMPDNLFGGARVETVISIFHKQIYTGQQCEVAIYPPNIKMDCLNLSGLSEHYYLDNQIWKQKLEKNFNPELPKKRLELYSLTLTKPPIYQLLTKIEQDSPQLANFCDFSLGITPYDKYRGHNSTQIKEKIFHSTKKLDKDYKPLLLGSDIHQYCILWNGKTYIKYGPWLGAAREERFFTEKHIIVRQIISGKPPRIYAALSENDSLYNTQIGFNIISRNESILSYEYLLALLNSKLMNFYHKNKFLDETKILFQKILIQNAKLLPIRLINTQTNEKIVEYIMNIIKLVKQEHVEKEKVINLLSTQFNLKKLNTRLKQYWMLSKDSFIQEIKKNSKINFDFNIQQNLERKFESNVKDLNDIIQQKLKLEIELNHLIYDIYQLNHQEIHIIEKN